MQKSCVYFPELWDFWSAGKFFFFRPESRFEISSVFPLFNNNGFIFGLEMWKLTNFQKMFHPLQFQLILSQWSVLCRKRINGGFSSFRKFFQLRDCFSILWELNNILHISFPQIINLKFFMKPFALSNRSQHPLLSYRNIAKIRRKQPRIFLIFAVSSHKFLGFSTKHRRQFVAIVIPLTNLLFWVDPNWWFWTRFLSFCAKLVVLTVIAVLLGGISDSRRGSCGFAPNWWLWS